MGDTGRMQPHEVAVLRRSLAMGGHADPAEVARALATLESLFDERAHVRGLLLRIQGAPCNTVRRLVNDLRQTLEA